MKKIYYEKVGRKYVPIAEYDQYYLSSFPKGSHLVMCYPGGESRRYNVDPNYAAMIAAGRVAQEAMSTAIRKASELQPKQKPLTMGQRKAWEKLVREFGDDLFTLQVSSSHDCAQEGVKAMMQEADKLLSNPAVKKAFDHFQLVCALTKEKNNQEYT